MHKLLIFICSLNIFNWVACASHQRTNAIDITLDIEQIIITNEAGLRRTVVIHPQARIPAFIKPSHSRFVKYGACYCCFAVCGVLGICIWRFR